MVTGESLPVEKNQLVMQLAPLSTAMGPFSLRLKKVGSETSYLQIVDFVKMAQSSRAPFKI